MQKHSRVVQFIIAAIFMASSTVASITYAQTSAFDSNISNSVLAPNQVLVLLPNKYDTTDIVKVEINDL
ncbi:hypothetical protein ERJ77_25600, partial [Vibrio anguillarum]|nr:hypothetical protein [Vibrio anguillarum]